MEVRDVTCTRNELTNDSGLGVFRVLMRNTVIWNTDYTCVADYLIYEIKRFN